MRQQISREDTNMQRQQHSEHTDRRIIEKNQVTISFGQWTSPLGFTLWLTKLH